MGEVTAAAGSPLSLIGIGPELEAVWRSLAACPDGEAAKHAAQTGLSVEQLWSTIPELLRSGIAREADGAPLGVVAIDPVVAIEPHLLRRERELADSAERIASVRRLMQDLRDDYLRGAALTGASTGFEFVETLDGIRRELYAAADRARSDIRTLDPGGLSVADELASIEHGKTTQVETLARGVRDRSILDQGLVADPELLGRQVDLRKRGALLRTLPQVTSRLTIFDRASAFVAVDPYDSGRGAVLIRAPGLIDSLIFMFDHLWSIAQPVFEIREAELPRVRGARILEFMAAGMKDDRIARALGVGPRTIRRDISRLKETLGVSSRTEIVAAAAKRGWL